MYEQGLPVDQHDGLPVGSSLGLVVHESQSLLMERMVNQGKPFWTAFGDEIRKSFPDLLGELSDEELYRRSNRVAFGLIRIDADELTYPLHIILRYEIEKALFENEIKIDELPEAWNAKCHELMGFIPPTDSQESFKTHIGRMAALATSLCILSGQCMVPNSTIHVSNITQI